ncbi:MAG: hypothetical protein P8L44_15525, partial [Opitutales bacterium]|nr:hypothetical protein [Opitutales bacterium]
LLSQNMINLRKELGRLKYLLLEDLPYRKIAARVPKMREALWSDVPKLTPLPEPRVHEIELHMYCGHRDAVMGIFASWSLLRFLEGKGMLYVHSDGSLTEGDIQRWSAVIPGLVAVSKEEADQRVAKVLKDSFKYLYEWRCTHGMSVQLIDAHLFGNSPKIISFDSDVLAFDNPEAFISSVLSNVNDYTWCKDVMDAYSAPRQLIKELFGVEMPMRFNGGCLATPRLDIDTFTEVDEIIGIMKQDGRIDTNHYWSTQTYYAILAARHGTINMMPSNYDTHKGRTRQNSTIRHYVGSDQIRFRFFTEGVPCLLQQIG